MNYVYNIKINLKDKLYNFYEWDKNDNIIVLNKVNVYFVDDKTYKDIMNMNIKVDSLFLNKIETNNYICIFSNEIDTVCIKFNKNGTIDKISKLDIEEESEILDEINNHKITILKYKLLDKNNNYSFNTREEDNIILELNNYIEKNKDNKEVIDYLYYEWFKNSKSNDKYNDLFNVINEDFCDKHNELYNVIKILV